MSKVLVNLKKKIDHYFYVITEIKKNKQILKLSSSVYVQIKYEISALLIPLF